MVTKILKSTFQIDYGFLVNIVGCDERNKTHFYFSNPNFAQVGLKRFSQKLLRKQTKKWHKFWFKTTCLSPLYFSNFKIVMWKRCTRNLLLKWPVLTWKWIYSLQIRQILQLILWSEFLPTHIRMVPTRGWWGLEVER